MPPRKPPDYSILIKIILLILLVVVALLIVGSSLKPSNCPQPVLPNPVKVPDKPVFLPSSSPFSSTPAYRKPFEVVNAVPERGKRMSSLDQPSEIVPVQQPNPLQCSEVSCDTCIVQCNIELVDTIPESVSIAHNNQCRVLSDSGPLIISHGVATDTQQDVILQSNYASFYISKKAVDDTSLQHRTGSRNTSPTCIQQINELHTFLPVDSSASLLQMNVFMTPKAYLEVSTEMSAVINQFKEKLSSLILTSKNSFRSFFQIKIKDRTTMKHGTISDFKGVVSTTNVDFPKVSEQPNQYLFTWSSVCISVKNMVADSGIVVYKEFPVIEKPPLAEQ